MSIKIDGAVNVTIVEAYLSNPKFPFDPAKDANPNNKGEAIQVWGDLILKCETADGQSDYWHGELSNRDGIGNFSNMSRTELTLKTLQDINFPMQDFTALCAQIADDGSLPNMVRLQCEAVVESREYNDKTYHQIKYLNAIGGGSIKRMDKAALSAAFQNGGFKKEIATTQQQPVQQQPAPPVQTAPPMQPGVSAVQQPAPIVNGTGIPPNPYAGN
jgi:hypothetical protein